MTVKPYYLRLVEWVQRARSGALEELPNGLVLHDTGQVILFYDATTCDIEEEKRLWEKRGYVVHPLNRDSDYDREIIDAIMSLLRARI